MYEVKDREVDIGYMQEREKGELSVSLDSTVSSIQHNPLQNLQTCIVQKAFVGVSLGCYGIAPDRGHALVADAATGLEAGHLFLCGGGLDKRTRENSQRHMRKLE